MVSESSGFRVLVTDYAWPNIDVEREVLAQAGAEPLVADTGEEAELSELASRVDAILTCYKKVGPETIAAASKCLVISRYGIGVDNVDLQAATEHGIVVTNVPDYCIDEVSDHAMALLLCVARRVMNYDRSVRGGKWDSKVGMPIPRLGSLVLGLIGFGRIARAVARKAQAFGLRVIAHDPYVEPDRMQREQVRPVDFQSLLQEADFVSIHVPLMPATHNLLGEKEFEKMKRTAWLVNTSRGGIVDTVALIAALRDGSVAGAALDVLTQEPPSVDDPLRSLPNVVLTPHTSYYSEGALRDLQMKAAGHVVEAFRGEIPTNVVNRAVLDRPNLRIKS